MRYFEDFAPGQVFDLGSRGVTAEEIVAFAQAWDPQPFHVDEEAARASRFSGLIASGWHSCSILMRLAVDVVLLDSASMGSPGVDELRWLRPVRPGDVLRGRMEVLEATPSERSPGRGTLRLALSLANQDDETVLTLTTLVIFARRPG